MINEASLKIYAEEKFSHAKSIELIRLGAGVHGTGFMLKIVQSDGLETSYVIKELNPQGLGHDYPSDRASVCLLALKEYNSLPKHVKAFDVLSVDDSGNVSSIGLGKDYYLLMETAVGTDYFNDLREMKNKKELDPSDIQKIKALSKYLAEIHSVKSDNRHLYWRKLRDTIGHGECLMGVFDFYPDGYLSYEEMGEIERLCIDWRVRLKYKHHRLCQIHGDFHPGNVWFKSDQDFVLLDRSRGAFGEAGDDITAMSINFIFFSIMYFGVFKGVYRKAFELFFDEYLSLTNDSELLEVLAPFYAFRGAVVCNPVFYPELTVQRRRLIIDSVKRILKSPTFDLARLDSYF